jgi:hypothetical protein
MGDAGSHLLGAGRSVGLVEVLPRFGEAHRREVAVEPAPNDAVVRGVGLEEERLADRERVELASTTRSPEIDFRKIWPGREKLVPLVVGHPDVAAHTGIMHLAGLDALPTSRRSASRPKLATQPCQAGCADRRE